MKFTIRDLFLVTAIVALALGWWVDHRSQNAALTAMSESQRETEEKLNRLLTAMERRGEKVTFSDMMVGIKSRSRGSQLYGVPSSEMARRMAVPTSQARAPNPPKD